MLKSALNRLPAVTFCCLWPLRESSLFRGNFDAMLMLRLCRCDNHKLHFLFFLISIDFPGELPIPDVDRAEIHIPPRASIPAFKELM